MLITHDVFDIVDRLKEIDSSYTLHYNFVRKKFELHGAKDECLLVFPYSEIDARMVTLARETRRERMDALIREMDEHNARIERMRAIEAENDALDRLKEIASKRYAKKSY